MHYECSEAIAQLICAFIFTCAKNSYSHDAAHILNLIKTVGKPEIVNIICTQIPSFNFSKSANCDCQSQETAYTVATKNVTQTKKDASIGHPILLTSFLNTLASLCNQADWCASYLVGNREDRSSHYEADFVSYFTAIIFSNNIY